MRRLIVNADDFGLTKGVNRAIAEAHTRGIVTSATMMANASAFEDAARLARELPALSIGCHALLVDGAPISDAAAVSTLISGRSSGIPRFRTSLSAFAACALTGRLDEAQIEAEVIAQIRKLQEVGIQVSHLDTHKHTHIFPAVFRPLLRAARTCGIRAVRNPFMPGHGVPFNLRRHPGLWKRQLQVTALQTLRSSFTSAVQDAGMITTGGSLGIVATGVLDLDVFRAIVSSLPHGVWEFICHPGYSDSDLDKVSTRLRQSREQELQLLTSEAVSTALEGKQISLISYKTLLESPKVQPAGSVEFQRVPKGRVPW